MKRYSNIAIWQYKRLARHLRGGIFKHLVGERSQRPNRDFDSGAALVITLMVVTIVSAIVFAVSRMLISEVKQITRLEEAEMAYQAAESGIETGLLLYRYNHEAEAPVGITGGMDSNQTNVMRVNVSESKLVCKDLYGTECTANPNTFNASQQYYDLKIWHKNENKDGKSTEEVAATDCVKNEKGQYAEYCVQDQVTTKMVIPALPKDGSVEYDVSGLDGNVTLKWEYLKEPSTIRELEQYHLEFIPLKENGEVDGERKDLRSYMDRNIGYTRNITGLSKIRLQSYGGDLKAYSLQAENLGSRAKLDSRYTYIESTGYYGGVKRKIKVKIDRQSGSIFGVYNFVMLTESDIKPSQ